MKTIAKLKYLLVLTVALAIVSCKDDASKKETKSAEDVETKTTDVNQEELKYVIDSTFAIGDVRRYGIKINGGEPKHPYTKLPTIQSILKLAENENIKLYFPEGYYKFGVYFKGIKNITVEFDNAEFGGPIYFMEDPEGNNSRDIKVLGNLTTYYKLFIRKSHDIEFNNVNVISNPEKNLSKFNSMGCDIYAASRFISFNNLTLDGLGSESDSYKLSRAALQVQGWNNNPEDIIIKNLVIKSSDRHAIYLTGNNHVIDKITIDKFGAGNLTNMNGLEDAAKGQTEKISGLWLNKCNNSTIGEVVINTKASKGTYSVWLDEGDTSRPTTIESITLNGGDSKLPLMAEETTNIVVRDLKK